MFSIKRLKRNLDIKSIKKRKVVHADFSFLRSRKSVSYIKKSKVLFIMRGLPGSGKSFIANLITRLYKKSSIICSADRYFIQNGKYVHNKKQLGEAHKYCQETCKKAMLIGKGHIIIDNTNVQKFETLSYLSLAKQNNYVTLMVEPKTPWKFDVNVLASRNKHGCPSEYIESKKSQYVDILPKYWGFFLNEFDSNIIRRLAKSHFLECMKLFPCFAAFVGSSTEDSTFYGTYYNIDNCKILHCTTCFSTSTPCSYASEKFVLDSIGKHFKLSISGFIYTSRVVAVVINLKPSQLILWNSEDNFSYVKDEHGVPIPSPASISSPQKDKTAEDQECNKESNINKSITQQISPSLIELTTEDNDAHSKLLLDVCQTNVVTSNEENTVIKMKKGSRAHMTVGCRKDVSNVQSGLDLLGLKHLYEEGKFKQTVFKKNLTFLYYGSDGCEVQFDWPLEVGSLFAGSYGCL